MNLHQKHIMFCGWHWKIAVLVTCNFFFIFMSLLFTTSDSDKQLARTEIHA